MASKAHNQQVYEELADWYDRHGQVKLRDWFLVLAADAAAATGQNGDAERLRRRLLQVNPHHLLRPFASFADALKSPDVLGYIADLRGTYPPASAEQLLESNRRQEIATDQVPASPPAQERELKVFRGQESRPRPTTAEPPASSAVPAMPLPVAWKRPNLPSGLRRHHRPADSSAEQEGHGALDYWVPMLLFVVVLLIGLSLLFYTIVWPFLTAGP